MVKLQYMGLIAVTISSILALSVTLPAASALIQRDDFSDTHTTVRFLGGIKVCGEHVCKPGEYNKQLKAMNDAQSAAGAKCREAMKAGKRC
ncbi:MAG TPA: hypothetical protein VK431_07140 [Nitrosopumilaceae archaeon]|nr:hypothetical protein [Nitrosopumilaceae archaeon]